MITAQRFTVQIEEKLLLKLLSFFGYDQAESGTSNVLSLCLGTDPRMAFFSLVVKMGSL